MLSSSVWGLPDMWRSNVIPSPPPASPEPTHASDDIVYANEQSPLIQFSESVLRNHLVFANQTYFEHMKDAMSYSWRSAKSSFCFMMHALCPSVFQHAGSDIIVELHDEIIEKYEKNIERVSRCY